MKKWALILALSLLWGCDESATPPPQTCSATVFWQSPVLLEDGRPFLLEDIEKFTIYVADAVGQQQFNLLFVFDVNNPTAMTHRINGLPKQSYIYMTVTATDGHTSAFSQEWSWNCVVGRPVTTGG